MLRKIPDSLIIVSVILLLFIGLTWLIPAGEFERQEVGHRLMVVPGSFHYVAARPLSPLTFFTAIIDGFVSAAEVIGFVFMVGGAFSMVTATGAIDAGLQKVVRFSYNNPRYKRFIIPVLMTFFSLAGCTFGMSEETLVFVLITIPLAYSLGYDAIVGTAIPFVGAGVGFAGAMFNPFTVGIAQGIAELPPFSGWEYRLLVWVVFTAIGIFFVMIYAARIGKDRKKSLVKDAVMDAPPPAQRETTQLTPSRSIILLLFMASLVILIYGVNVWEWYIREISGLFIALGVFSVLVFRLSGAEAVKAFTGGAKDMMAAALIIGVSKGVLVVAEQGRIIDTILHAVSSGIGDMPEYLSVQVMFFIQTFINFFIPSGSGQAAITMPLMTPLSDLLGISRQTAVLAYQFGDGISNLVIPTSGVTMGILAIAKVPYEIWLKWIWKLIAILFIASMIFLAIPTTVMHWN